MAKKKVVPLKAKKQKPDRKLVTGDLVPSLYATHRLTIETKAPHKWLFVDRESGTVWHKTHEKGMWTNIGYVDIAGPTSMVILPTGHGGIPHFNFRA